MKIILGIVVMLALIIGISIIMPREAQSPIVSPIPDSEVSITAPQKGVKITSPLLVKGTAPGTWYFEANIRVLLENQSGETIAQAGGQAQSEWMTVELVPFEALLTFDAEPSGSAGYIVVKNDNPSGLPENEKEARFPIVFN